MKNISFSMTLKQFKARQKFVTRRLGWADLGTRVLLQAVEKAQGLKRGEKIQKLDKIVVFFVRREPLDAITKDDCILEGFPEMSPAEFIEFFAKSHRCKRNEIVTRIEYGYWADDDSGDCLVAVGIENGEIITETHNFKMMISR